MSAQRGAWLRGSSKSLYTIVRASPLAQVLLQLLDLGHAKVAKSDHPIGAGLCEKAMQDGTHARHAVQGSAVRSRGQR